MLQDIGNGSLGHLGQSALARRWGISPRTLERWRWLGQGPRFLKLGSRVVYRLEDIVAFEAQQLRAARAALGYPEPKPECGGHG